MFYIAEEVENFSSPEMEPTTTFSYSQADKIVLPPNTPTAVVRMRWFEDAHAQEAECKLILLPMGPAPIVLDRVSAEETYFNGYSTVFFGLRRVRNKDHLRSKESPKLVTRDVSMMRSSGSALFPRKNGFQVIFMAERMTVGTLTDLLSQTLQCYENFMPEYYLLNATRNLFQRPFIFHEETANALLSIQESSWNHSPF